MALDKPEDLLGDVLAIALRAGKEVMRVYSTDFDVTHKEDKSPVTEADKAAEAIITPALQELLPGVPVVAEEAVSDGETPDVGDEPFWLVDPVDGTKQFISKNGEFTVNIALIENRRPVLGVVHCPALHKTYWGGPKGGWVKDGNSVPKELKAPAFKDGDPITAVASRSHRTPETDAYLDKFNVAELISAGSSLKFCLVAEGAAHLYPRFGPTMEWDVGAGHAVLQSAGGIVTNEDGSEFLYNKPEFRNGYFIARGPKS